MDCGIIIYSLLMVAALGQNLYQEQISETKKEKQIVSFNCKVTGRCAGNNLHWYQKRLNEPFTWILYMSLADNSVSPETTHPQRADFSTEKLSDSSQLKIQSVKESHAATYYCACYQTGTHSVK
ncbi:hypothetical protein DPEC_G00058080 [Dallia pectoralis]|uniref:Uncharacterized protein n=1 Tax=Dallia pectoralis TaxID=75939 RepID=A0ACC2H6U7_DALPE|nr:hypothetical protein DPEC_G00058080 [Dallia pectoralis]